MTRAVAPCVLAVAALAASSCGYGLAGRNVSLPGHIKTIGIQTFANRSGIPDLDKTLTEAVQRELVSRGRWKVVQGIAGADAIVSGTIGSVTQTPRALNQSSQASRVEIAVTASIEFKDAQDGKVLWSNGSLVSRDEFEVTSTTSPTDPSAYLRQNTDAYQRLATRFARTVVQSMLEGM